MSSQNACDYGEMIAPGGLIAEDHELWPKREIRLPALPMRYVPRSRLVDKLNAGLNDGSQFTLISAPAGYGKTTAVIEWMSQMNQAVARVNASPPRSSPRRFWIEVIAALRGAHDSLDSGLSNLLQSGVSPIDLPNVLTTLIHQLEVLSEPLFLVIDDYRASKALDATLLYFVKHLPPHVHLVVTTRTEVTLPLARQRLDRQVTEIGVRELSFTEQEAARLLVEVMGLELSASQVGVLQSKTEGWVAALLLAASRLERQSKFDYDVLITSLSGGPRYVLDYLREEVLRNLPRDSYQFLREVSILQRMSASLCDAVTGRQDSLQMLDKLERTSLFVQPLDDERLWYRCHGLVARTLRVEFEQSSPEQFHENHIRASEWFASHGQADEAFRHALAASDYERCADIIDREYRTIWFRGEIGLLGEWIAQMPEKLFVKWPCLDLVSGAVFLADGRLDLASLRLARAERALSEQGDDSLAEMPWLRGSVQVTRAGILFLNGDYSGALGLIRRLNACPYQIPSVQVTAHLIAGITESRLGNTEGAREYLLRCLLMAQPTGDLYSALSAYVALGDVLILEGKLREAHDICLKALSSSEDNRAAAPLRAGVSVNLARVYYEWDQLDAAKRAVVAYSGDAILDRLQIITTSHLSLLEAKLGLSPMDTNVLWQSGKFPMDPVGVDTVHANQLLTLLWQGKMLDSDALVDGFSLDEVKPSVSNAPVLLAYAKWLIAHRYLDRYLDKASRLLGRMAAAASVSRHRGLHIQIRLLQSLAIYLSGDSERALVPLQHVLAMAEPEGYVRTFVDLGKPMKKLLRLSFDRGLSTDYVARLLEAFERQVPPSSGAHAQVNSEIIMEPLSKRELETLRLLAEGSSFQEVATKLGISLNTIRTHTKSIYHKLEVNTLTKAVVKATKLGLLDFSLSLS